MSPQNLNSDVSSANDTASSVIQKLAWRAWSAGGTIIVDDGIRGDVEPLVLNGTLVEHENGLRFSSEESMVEAACDFVLQTESLLLVNLATACFTRLHDIWRKEIGKEPLLSSRVLASLHNDRSIDAYYWAQQAIEGGVREVDVLRVMEDAVAQFEHAYSETVFKFFACQSDRGMLCSNLPDWFARHPFVALEVKRLHEETPTEPTASLYCSLLQGLIINNFDTGFAHTLAAAKAASFHISKPAIIVFGLVDYIPQSRTSAVKEVIELCTGITRADNHPLLNVAVRTLTRLVKAEESIIVDALDSCGRTAAPDALLPLSEFLWLNERSFGEKEWYNRLLNHLTAAKPEHHLILNNVDMIIDGWIGDDLKRTAALKFINSWILRQDHHAFRLHGVEATLPSTIHRLSEKPEALSRLVTEWLLQEDTRYCVVAQKLVQHLRVEGITSLELYPPLMDRLESSEICFSSA